MSDEQVKSWSGQEGKSKLTLSSWRHLHKMRSLLERVDAGVHLHRAAGSHQIRGRPIGRKKQARSAGRPGRDRFSGLSDCTRPPRRDGPACARGSDSTTSPGAPNTTPTSSPEEHHVRGRLGRYVPPQSRGNTLTRTEATERKSMHALSISVAASKEAQWLRWHSQNNGLYKESSGRITHIAL